MRTGRTMPVSFNCGLLVLVALWACGCSRVACDTAELPGLELVVTGGGSQSGAGGAGGLAGYSVGAECVSRVSVSPNSNDFHCATGSSGECQCSGFSNYSGKIEITVELEGLTETRSIDIVRDECGPVPQKLCIFGDC